MPRMNQLSTYCTTITNADERTIITYHRTAIVEFDGDTITLRTGGWDSVTTRRKMNQAAAQFGLHYSVFRDKGESLIRQPDGAVVPLHNNQSFARR